MVRPGSLDIKKMSKKYQQKVKWKSQSQKNVNWKSKRSQKTVKNNVKIGMLTRNIQKKRDKEKSKKKKSHTSQKSLTVKQKTKLENNSKQSKKVRNKVVEK